MYTIWYTKAETWETQRRSGIAYEFDGDECPYTVKALPTTHVALMSNVYGDDLDGMDSLNNIYHDYQAENMSDRLLPDWGKWTRDKGAGHASMSVGDVIQDQKTGECWVVAPVGFVLLSKGE